MHHVVTSSINVPEAGVTDAPLSWLRSYLESRTRFVKLGQHQSPAVGLDVGVPQGSVLGPLLFAVYCSPAADVIVSHGVQFHQYATTHSDTAPSRHVF